MINLLQSQDTINITGFDKNWFTDRHQREVVDLKPFNGEELDRLTRAIMIRKNSQTSIVGVLINTNSRSLNQYDQSSL